MTPGAALLGCALWALLTAARALDDEMAELARMLRENCVEETGVDMALLDAINTGAAITPDPKLKCYMKCVMETAGMMTDGVVDVEAVVAIMPDDMRRKNEAPVRGCGSPSGADACDTAYLTQTCWQRANPNDYFLI
ncbi:general odorant-binding protein 69a-like [Battus philenor]|uniref:general odorant-binding protein 69a-like n=1 Tax=Battus philenor TaxID=42288 RepID=UPI0035CEC1A9